MLSICNDPFKTIFEVVLEEFGNVNAIIQFGQVDGGNAGDTCFPEDKSTPIITISVEIPFHATVEILAHELAHVIAGADEKHGENWEAIFSKIHKGYMAKMFSGRTGEEK